MKSEYFESPTIILITDRTDLDDQLWKQFSTHSKINYLRNKSMVAELKGQKKRTKL